MTTPNPNSDTLVASVGVECNVGKERTENQDRVMRAATPFGDLFIVADGVGGYLGGAEAAQATVDGFVNFLKAHGTISLSDALQQSLKSISADLQQRSAVNPALQGMGSTVVLCVVAGNRATYAHAGDSRAYLVRDGKLRQLTRDHSVMERFIAQGVLTPAQAREHPDASVLTRAIGHAMDITLDIAEIELLPNDALLLCSDGLWGYAKHEEMEAVATSKNLSSSAIAAALLKLALEGGGGDNISIQFLRFEALRPARKSPLGLSIPMQKALPVVAVAAVLGIGSVAMYVSNSRHPLVSATAPPPVAVPQEPAPASIPSSPSAAPVQKSPAAESTTPDGKPKSAPAKANHAAKDSILVIAAKDGSVASWADQLDDYPYLQVSQRSGDDRCLTLQQSDATLIYSQAKAETAKRIQHDLDLTAKALRQRPVEDLRKCGSEELLAMPGHGDAIDRMKDKAKVALDPLKKKGEDEINKHKDQIPDLPSPAIPHH